MHDRPASLHAYVRKWPHLVGALVGVLVGVWLEFIGTHKTKGIQAYAAQVSLTRKERDHKVGLMGPPGRLMLTRESVLPFLSPYTQPPSGLGDRPSRYKPAKRVACQPLCYCPGHSPVYRIE